KGEGRIFSDFDEVILAYEQGDVTTHTPIRVRYSGKYIDLTTQYNDQDIVHAEVQDVERTLIDTTVGRVLYNRALPEVVPFINGNLKKRGLSDFVNYIYLTFGEELCVQMLDDLKDLGFNAATRAGISVLQYFISTHGARKGLADTALKTADSGYLTRRLVDVAQDVIVIEEDCGTSDGITVTAIMEGGDTLEPLRDRIVGRVAQEDIYDPLSEAKLAAVGEEITEDLASSVQEGGIERVKIRSVL